MLRRTSINFVNNTLSKNANWKIADIGCGYSANKNASVIADIQDLSNFYKGKNFIKISGKKLPFKDKEFDFVITSHVIEHVEDFEFFVKELERISSRGYIELPTRLGDNLVFENRNDHIWWFTYNDVNNQIIASKRNQLISKCLEWGQGGTTSFNGDTYVRECLKEMIVEAPWGRTTEAFLVSIDERLGGALESLVPKAFGTEEGVDHNQVKKE